MFELENEKSPDFLFLFETLQDVAILDAEFNPAAVQIYQLKKKERKEWSWVDLTALDDPTKPVKKKAVPKQLAEIQSSPIGKLYATIRALRDLNARGRFVSNAGCDLILENGGNAATSMPIQLSDLSQAHRDLLLAGFETLHDVGDPQADLSCIHLERVDLAINDLGTQLLGVVHKFLEARSPRHLGQAQSLVNALLVKLGPLSAHTDTCQNFDELRRQRGYSRKEFVGALAELETVPDQKAELDEWLRYLQDLMPFGKVRQVRASCTALFRRRLAGATLDSDDSISAYCSQLRAASPVADDATFFQKAEVALKQKYPLEKEADLIAHLLLREIEDARS
jgi:hypothetical protein